MPGKGIKTRQRAEKTIKRMDKSAVVGNRMKRAYAKTKERARSSQAEEASPAEYAVSETNNISNFVFQRGSRKLSKAGKQSVETTKDILTGTGKMPIRRENAVVPIKKTAFRHITHQPEQAKNLAQNRLRAVPKATPKKRKTMRKAARAIKRASTVTKAGLTAILAGGWLVVMVILFLCLFGAALFLFDNENADENPYTGDGILGLPIAGMTQADISSHYGSRPSPGGIGSTYHQGIDIAFPLGTDVLACESGTVTYAGENGALGKCVIINHGEGLQTVYGHMSKIKVMKGEKVRRSQPVGEVGNTGASTGPHLHLAVLINGNYVNPERGWLDFAKQ